MGKESGVVPYEDFRSFVLNAGSRILNGDLPGDYSPREAKAITRSVEFAVLYYDGAKTLRELGNYRHLSKPQTGQLVRRGVAFLRANFEQESKVDFDGAAVAKRPISTATRRRLSQAIGGTSVEIQARLEAGVPASAIVKEYGRRVSDARQTLRRQGVELPYVRTPRGSVRKTIADLESLCHYEGPDKERSIRNLLPRVTYQVYRRARDNFVTISDLARAVGLRPPSTREELNKFTGVLIWTGIPIQTVIDHGKGGKERRYHIVHFSHKQRGEAAFRVAPELARF